MVEDWNGIDCFHDSFDDAALLEEREDPQLLEWAKMEGTDRIDELSRQLNTFFNYKNSIIRLRFSGTRKEEDQSKKDEIVRLGRKLNELFSQLESLLGVSRRDDEKIEEQIKHLMMKALAQPNGLEGGLLKELEKLCGDTWMSLHVLSTRELHHHPLLLEDSITIAKLACAYQGTFYYPFTSFYGELRRNYSRLEQEVISLRVPRETRRIETKNTKKRLRILE